MTNNNDISYLYKIKIGQDYYEAVGIFEDEGIKVEAWQSARGLASFIMLDDKHYIRMISRPINGEHVIIDIEYILLIGNKTKSVILEVFVNN